jgi:hypothetical protein
MVGRNFPMIGNIRGRKTEVRRQRSGVISKDWKSAPRSSTAIRQKQSPSTGGRGFSNTRKIPPRRAAERSRVVPIAEWRLMIEALGFQGLEIPEVGGQRSDVSEFQWLEKFRAPGRGAVSGEDA